jgi:hypothetical protein
MDYLAIAATLLGVISEQLRKGALLAAVEEAGVALQ